MSIDLSVPSIDVLHLRRSEKWALHEPDVLSATIAEMDFPLAEPVAESLRSAVARHDLGYAPPNPASLRRAFATFAARRMSWNVDEDQVVLVPDVMDGLVRLCKALPPREATVALATPAYPPFFAELPLAGVKLREIGIDADGSLDLDELDRALAGGIRALILANPHNPTGRVLSRSHLAEIAERCAEREVWVLADEIHAPLTMAGATHLPWLEVSDAARSRGVALTSASKAFNLPALKAALMVTASDTARDLVASITHLHDHVSLLGVIAAEAAFIDGDPWLDAVIEQLERNREQLAVELAGALPEIRWDPPDATYLAWLDCTALALGEDPAEVFLRGGRVALSPGPAYGHKGAGHARLNFATSPELVSEAVRRMSSAVARAERS